MSKRLPRLEYENEFRQWLIVVSNMNQVVVNNCLSRCRSVAQLIDDNILSLIINKQEKIIFERIDSYANSEASTKQMAYSIKGMLRYSVKKYIAFIQSKNFKE